MKRQGGGWGGNAPKCAERAFTLIEVMVALAILALSMGVILQGNVMSIAAVERIDGMTRATLLGRLKMQEIERELLKKGFKTDVEEMEGDFDDLGSSDIKWKARVDPVKVQLEKLTDMANAFGGGADGGSGSGDKGKSAPPSANSSFGNADPLAMLQPILTPIAQGISQNLRLVQLEVSWPEGKKRGKFDVTAMITSKAMQTSAPTMGGPSGASAPAPGSPSGVIQPNTGGNLK